MGNIVMNMSMSLDGFIAAKNDTPEQPLGEDGQRLHAWYFKANAAVYNQEIEEDLALCWLPVISVLKMKL